jgi:23S rRNA (uracil1939-C5)-methyltransferase
VFFYGGLPSEKILVEVYKNKKDYALANLVEVIEKNPNRIPPEDKEIYLSTSPFQILNYEYELFAKKSIIKEAFQKEKINLNIDRIFTDNNEFHYRNKMEYSFYFNNENNKLYLAFFMRGKHYKIPFIKESLAKNEINNFAFKVLNFLNEKKIDGRKIKSLLVRANKNGLVKGQLYLKDEKLFEELASKKYIENNLEFIFSNPNSPASIISKRINKNKQSLEDEILGIRFRYSVESFFQINLPLYEEVLKDIMKFSFLTHKNIVDFYSGVGTIGLTLFKNRGKANIKILFVEIDKSSCVELEKNIIENFNNELGSLMVINANTDSVLNYIKKDEILVVDPPRAGLSKKVIMKIKEIRPLRLIYLSCNPITQARDIGCLKDCYNIIFNKGYNFFPRTVHIENLVVLDADNK